MRVQSVAETFAETFACLHPLRYLTIELFCYESYICLSGMQIKNAKQSSRLFCIATILNAI